MDGCEPVAVEPGGLVIMPRNDGHRLGIPNYGSAAAGYRAGFEPRAAVKHMPGPKPRTDASTSLASASLVLAVLLWSGDFIAGRAMGDSFTAVGLNFRRWSLAPARRPEAVR